MYFLQWWWSSSSSSSSRNTPCSKSRNGFRDLHEKARIINLVLLEPSVDLWKLRDLALTEGGLVNDTLRKLAWPKLVGLHLLEKDNLLISTSSSMTTAIPDKSLSSRSLHFETITSSNAITSSGDAPHRDDSDVSMDSTPGSTNNNNSHQSPREDPVGSLFVESLDVEQIQRDVDRCTWHLITGSQPSLSKQLLKKKQRRLANFINLTLVESYPITSSAKPTTMEQEPRLRYYQGYHDVACIFLRVLGEAGTKVPATTTASSNSDQLDLQMASQVLSRVSLSHLKDFCQDDFGRLQATIHLTFYPLLYQLDPLVHNRLHAVDMEPFFCLSWILTWFSHNVRDTNLCTRLFDAFVASHPLLVLYVALAMILHPYNRKCVLETDCDFAALHHTLTNLPQHSCRVGWTSMLDDDDDDGTGDAIDHDCRQLEQQHDSLISENDPTSSTDQTPSLSSSSRRGFNPSDRTEQDPPCEVPFETLLDMALEYMAQYPPRSVHDLARQYYGPSHESMSKFNPTSSKGSTTTTAAMRASSGCALLQEAPTSCLRSTCPPDWVLKQRLQNRMGLPCSSSRENACKNKSLEALMREEKAALDIVALPHDDGTPDYEYLKRHATDRAVIAAGFGLGPEVAQSLRQQRIRYAKAVAVGFVAMSIGLGIQYYWYSKTKATPSRKAAFVKTLIHPERIHHSNHVLSTSVGDSIGVLEACYVPMACMLHQVSAEGEEKLRLLAQSTQLNDLAHSTTPPAPDTSHKYPKFSPPSPESEDLSLSTTVVMDCGTDKGLDKPHVAPHSSSAVEKEGTLSFLHILSQSTGANEHLELSPPPHEQDSVDSDDGPLGLLAQALDEDLELSAEQAFPHPTEEMKETQFMSTLPSCDASVVESTLHESMPPVPATPSTIANTNNVDMFILGSPGGMVNRITSKVHGIVLRSLEWLICRGHLIWNSLRKLRH